MPKKARIAETTRYADDDPAALKRLGLIVDIETTRLDFTSFAVLPLNSCQRRMMVST